MNFIDLTEQQEMIREEIYRNISKVLDHGKYINGPEVVELETKLAKYVDVSYAVGCSSGTDALLMALMAYNTGPGDIVFTTPFTFFATAEVIQLLGATVVFVDIEPDTYNIDALKLEEVVIKTINESSLTPRGIIPVDLFGQAADYDEINSVAKRHDLFVVEDGAQSFGATYKGRKCCSLSDIGITSFFPAKPLGCYGDGGMLFSNDKELYEKLISIRVHGQGKDKYHNIRTGLNGRLDAIQAAILLAKYEIFDDEMILRQEVAGRYYEGLCDFVVAPLVRDYNISSWAQYSILHPERDEIISKLTEKGIPTSIYYPIPLHLQDALNHLGYKRGDFPVTEEISKKIFSIPMYPYLKAEDQEKIIEVISEFR